MSQTIHLTQLKPSIYDPVNPAAVWVQDYSKQSISNRYDLYDITKEGLYEIPVGYEITKSDYGYPIVIEPCGYITELCICGENTPFIITRNDNIYLKESLPCPQK